MAAGVKVEVDGSRQPLRMRRKTAQRVERLLEAGRRRPMGRALCRLRPGPVEKGDGLLPFLAPERVMGQPLDVLGETLGVDSLDRLDGPGVEGAPALL